MVSMALRRVGKNGDIFLGYVQDIQYYYKKKIKGPEGGKAAV